jgi:hypothetical protein
MYVKQKALQSLRRFLQLIPSSRNTEFNRMGNLTIRSPHASEVARALRFFEGEHVKAEAQVLVAVKATPVERFLGALAGWVEGDWGRFHLACLPGVARQETASALIREIVLTARAAGLKGLMYAKLLADGQEPGSLLVENGFEILRSERFFQLAVETGQRRVLQLLANHQAKIPSTWRTESLRHQPPECVLDLIAPYRLMTPEEVRSCWHWGERTGFDPDLSSILLENERAFGTLLARRKGELLCYDIRVARHSNPRLRALANLCLFHHSIKNHDLTNPVRWLQFRGGEQEHKETANLAMRMGGTELPPRHVLAMSL